MATERKERLAQNEALFRVANERMADWEESHAEDSAESYFCECADPDCREKVSLRRSEYESVRSNPRRFFIVVGHEIPDVETVKVAPAVRRVPTGGYGRRQDLVKSLRPGR